VIEKIEKTNKVEVVKENRVYKRKVSMWHGLGFITGLLSYLVLALFMSSMNMKKELIIEEKKELESFTEAISKLEGKYNKIDLIPENLRHTIELEDKKAEDYIINKDDVKIHIINTKYEMFLMNKYKVPIYLRNYTTKLCRYYNIELTKFLGMIQIESWWGKHKDYKKFTIDRTYGPNKEYADIGLAQLSSRYFTFFEEEHFDFQLLYSLGYERNKFDAKDDIINLQVAASYFSWLQSYFHGDIESSLVGYNAGPYVSKIPLRSLIYTKAIMNNYEYVEQAKLY